MIIKTFVTTDLQKAIAEHYGLRCVETLTGFKYIGAKLGKYERAIPEKLRNEYVDLSEEESRKLRLEHSSFYVFGGEESYGYSGGDFVRDKDGNGSAIMFCEVAAYAKSQRPNGRSIARRNLRHVRLLRRKERLARFRRRGRRKQDRAPGRFVRDRAAGEMLGSRVTSIRNFETETIRDVEGDEIPKEKMSIFELEDRTRIAVRASGTEPKIKYYLFAQRRPDNGKFDSATLGRSKAKWAKDWSAFGIGCKKTQPRVSPDKRSTARKSRRRVDRAARNQLDRGEITILKTIGLSGSPMLRKNVARPLGRD